MTNHPVPWRVGGKVGRTIYDSHNELIGVMDTKKLAAVVVASVNAVHIDLPTKGLDRKKLRDEWTSHVRKGLQ